MNKGIFTPQDAYYSYLTGAKIIDAGVRVDKDGEGAWPFFRIEKDGVVFDIEVSVDVGGSAPGHLLGLPTEREKNVGL